MWLGSIKKEGIFIMSLICTCQNIESCPALGSGTTCFPWCDHLQEGPKATPGNLAFLRELMPKGTKIVLDQMVNDPYPVPNGTIGMVDHIDDAGQIHCRWATGSGLAVIPGVDHFHILTENTENQPVGTQPDRIFTHDETTQIVEMFESLLEEHNIVIPSPEDDQRDPDNAASLYGSTYSDLHDRIEEALLNILKRHSDGADVVAYEYSGTM